MTSKEFVLWLKGFTEGVHEYNINPKQWDILKDKLAEVKDEEPIGFPFGVPNTAPNTHPFPTWQQPHKVNPFYVGDVPIPNPYGIFGTGTTQTVVTTTPGGGSITYAKPQFVTLTAMGYPSGSTMSCTTPTWKPEHGLNSPTIQNINESLEELENDFFGALDGEDGWTPDLEKQFWAEQPPELFATPEELAKYNTDAV